MVLTADRRLKFSQGVWHCVREYSAHAQSGNVLVNAFQDLGVQASEVVENE